MPVTSLPDLGILGAAGDVEATFGLSAVPRATGAGASTLVLSDFGGSDLTDLLGVDSG